MGQNYGLSALGYISTDSDSRRLPQHPDRPEGRLGVRVAHLIAAELVFGVSSGSGGLGWYIFENKNELLFPEVFAGLLTVILFGLFVENVIFRTIESRTVRRWGMQT